MPEGKDFFISYTGKDTDWAKWIDGALKSAGFTTRVQCFDFGPGKNFVLEMHAAAIGCARTMPIYSPDYFAALYTHPEWAAAFANDPVGKDQKLIPVRVRECKPEGLLAPIVYVDIVGLDEKRAKDKFLEAVSGLPPLNVNFPGTKLAPVVETAASFPGTPTDGKAFLQNLPFDSNPLFTGREKMLDDLGAALQKKTAAAITQPQAVHGLGGVGKTQLAIEYAWRHKADYDAVLWVVAESPSELHAKMAALAPLLNLPEAAATQQEVKVDAVVAWLRSHQRWLLVLDNADTKEARDAVLKLLPPGLSGHIIVTSRLAEWPVGYEDVEVTVLPELAAKEFLLKRAHKGGSFDPGSEAEAVVVAKELGCLPLALEQAGAYIARRHITFPAYLGKLKESRAEVLKFPSRGGTGYQKTVATTWLVSEPHLSLTARAILQMSAFLAPDDIPRALFCECHAEVTKAVLLLGGEAKGEGQEQSSEERIQDALAELFDHSMIELDASTFSCHRLVQAALLGRLKTDERQGWAEATLDLVNKYAPAGPGDVRTWPVWDVLSPHASALLKEFWSQANTDASRLMNELGVLLDAKALYADAETFQRRALAIDEKRLGSEHPNVAVKVNNLAGLLQATNRLGEAEPLMRRALAIDEKSFGPEHPDVARDLNNLAQLLKATNRLGEAEPLMRRGVAIEEKSFGREHPEVAGGLSNLAQLLKATNRLGEAEPLMRRALAIDEKSFGPDHPKVATRLNNLAQLLQDTNRLGEAELLMRRALAIDEKSFGPDHPKVAIRLNNLATLLQVTNRRGEAEPLMRRALAMDEKSFGPEHPRVATSLNNLAQLLQATNRLGEVEPLMRRALAIDEKSFGPDHPDVAIDLNNLAALLHATNRLGEAEPLIRRALAIDEKSFGPDHPDVAIDLSNLAQLLQDTGRQGEAEPLVRRALRVFYVSLGLEHPRTQTACDNYKSLLARLKLNPEQIEAKVREAFKT